MASLAYLKTDCDHCNGPIEFPTQLAGQSVACPHCHAQTLLPQFQPATAPPPTPPAPPTMVRSLLPPEDRRRPTPQSGFICESCGTVGKSVWRTKGSFAVELALWLLFCAPGLIYSLWRLTSNERVCAGCAGRMISVSTPRGIHLWRTYHE
jgi:hypothetical protein